jgi:catechol 2,3-dioxygenase-like lactoylglutathione lyase family enzyme
MIRAIDIVTIPVRDQDAALKFYTEKLGFKVATNQDFGDGKQRWIELLIPGAESRLALFTPEGFENRIGGFQPVTFRCDDVYATAEALKSRGVKLAAEPKKEIWGTMAQVPAGAIMLHPLARASAARSAAAVSLLPPSLIDAAERQGDLESNSSLSLFPSEEDSREVWVRC